MTLEAAPARDPFALSEEERSVRDTVREWAQREVAPGAAERDEEERYDVALFQRAGELGLTGLPYPERTAEPAWGRSPGRWRPRRSPRRRWRSAVSLSVHILTQLCIFSSGSDEQKERFLPPMTAGRELGAFALTEPGAGSDAAALSLSARRDGDAYLLNGTKIWITNAGEAARYVVFATVDGPWARTASPRSSSRPTRPDSGSEARNGRWVSAARPATSWCSRTRASRPRTVSARRARA